MRELFGMMFIQGVQLLICLLATVYYKAELV